LPLYSLIYKQISQLQTTIKTKESINLHKMGPSCFHRDFCASYTWRVK
jgi:hypothetical protein